MALACLTAVLALASRPAAASDLEHRVQEVASEIRCPVCKGLSAWESDTGASRAIVEDIRQRLARGETKEQILAAYEREYGPWILMRPPRRGFSWTAYLAPVGLMGLGGAVIAVALRRSRRRRVTGDPEADTPEADDDAAYREQVDEILRHYL